MTQSLLLGVDAGTTACKVVVADQHAHILGIGAAPYPVNTPRSGWAEQDADTVFNGVIAAIRAALESSGATPAHVRALSFSGALHSLFAVDADGTPLIPALIWADSRSTDQARALRTRTDPAALYRRTGCPIQAMYPLSKLCWLQQHRPDVFDAADKWLSIKDYVIYRLTGRILTEPSIASGTGYLDLAKRAWDPEALRLAGITPDRLPALRPSAHQLPLSPAGADAVGLPASAVIILGGSDGALANLGAGAVEVGTAALTIGSSGALRFIGAAPLTHPDEHTWCYLVPGGAYLVGGAINNGGIVLKWFHDTFAEVEDEQDAAAALPPGAEGLIFLPFLTGERCPNWNADARGVLFGLALGHTRAHIVRAIMEGVAFRMYSILRALDSLDTITAIHASGGFINSPLWLQIVADVFGRAIRLPDTREMSGMGAVFVAMQALGLVDTLAETARFVKVGAGALPDVGRHALYQDLFAQFEAIYAHVAPDFAALADFKRARV